MPSRVWRTVSVKRRSCWGGLRNPFGVLFAVVCCGPPDHCDSLLFPGRDRSFHGGNNVELNSPSEDRSPQPTPGAGSIPTLASNFALLCVTRVNSSIGHLTINRGFPGQAQRGSIGGIQRAEVNRFTTLASGHFGNAHWNLGNSNATRSFAARH